MNIVKELNILLEDFKFTPRRLQSREEERIKKLELLLQQTHIKGDLNLNGCTNLTSLGNLTSVGGDFDLVNCTNLTSLGNLESVGGYLYLNSCTNLSSLGNLEYVEGNLDLNGTNITSLGNLKSVVGFLNIRKTNITSLDNLESVGRYLYLNGNITYIDPSIIIKGSIYKGQNVFKSIESFNEYYKDKQNLNEDFKFEPRRLDGREEELKRKTKEIADAFWKVFKDFDTISSIIKKKFDHLYDVKEVSIDNGIDNGIDKYNLNCIFTTITLNSTYFNMISRKNQNRKIWIELRTNKECEITGNSFDETSSLYKFRKVHSLEEFSNMLDRAIRGGGLK